MPLQLKYMFFTLYQQGKPAHSIKNDRLAFTASTILTCFDLNTIFFGLLGKMIAQRRYRCNFGRKADRLNI